MIPVTNARTSAVVIDFSGYPPNRGSIRDRSNCSYPALVFGFNVNPAIQT
jgi:hypothetical protein